MESHIEGNLATEVSMIVLDTLTVVEQVLSEKLLKYKFAFINCPIGGGGCGPFSDPVGLCSQGDAACPQHKPGAQIFKILSF